MNKRYSNMSYKEKIEFRIGNWKRMMKKYSETLEKEYKRGYNDCLKFRANK